MFIKKILFRLKIWKLKIKGAKGMDEIEMYIEELKKAIRRSNEYTQYQIIWEDICRDQGLKDRLNQFRRERFMLEMGGAQDTIGKMEELSRNYSDVLEKSLVKDFLAAEQRIAKRVRYIENTLLETVNMDLDFLN